MISITLEPLNHNSKNCIAIKFPYSFKLKEYIKKFNNVYWSKTHRTFYIFFNETRLEDLKEHIKKGGYTILSNTSKDNIKPFVKDLKINLEPLNIEKDKIYRHFLDFLKGKRFSESTISSYGHFVFSFLRFTKEKPINELNENDVRLYIESTVSRLNYSISTHRQMVSGLTHFAYFYPACAINVEKIHMPKKDKKLPTVLAIEEILLLLQLTKNLKHRVIIAMLYSSGLRISELLNLKLNNFDFKRKQLHIKNAKGRKDRYATIAESLFPLLKNYYNTYKPKVFL